MASPSEWYSSLPPITKLYGVACFAATTFYYLGLVDPMNLALFWPLTLRKLQARRRAPLRPAPHKPAALARGHQLCLPRQVQHELRGQDTVDVRCARAATRRSVHAPPSFRYGCQLETNTYGGRLGDYAWLLLFSMGVLVASALLVPSYFLGSALIMVLVYTWSRENQTAAVSFFGIFTIEGFYLPFVLVGWDLVTGNDPGESIRGILAGHVYYFLAKIWPASGGPTVMKTPAVVQHLCAWAFGGVGMAAAPEYLRPRQAAFQGRGQRLGGHQPAAPAARPAWRPFGDWRPQGGHED